MKPMTKDTFLQQQREKTAERRKRALKSEATTLRLKLATTELAVKNALDAIDPNGSPTDGEEAAKMDMLASSIIELVKAQAELKDQLNRILVALGVTNAK
ncbi:MAG: hypothetical protein EOP09_00215 [Proteobacteria bacterium]|nr:MAG: hypothetical protein EOP09_00215 [Pseudomonadota bacterium]